MISSTGPKVELSGFLPLKNQMCCANIENDVIQCIEKQSIALNKILFISIEGAKHYDMPKKKVVSILKEKINYEILAYSCIIHKETLCTLAFREEIYKIMELVFKIIT
ncbi:hypothetical protein RF11_01226 [Thelohanellus kitauei]|uniref:Uncharacterized protein n=1 Tax=Thelohanellus kitauei TaxID=669202 RepID=A0A0C2N5Q5_THEKT|nr:hypothetical protein RF11_01226 [Thelohanellus kitauei]